MKELLCQNTFLNQKESNPVRVSSCIGGSTSADQPIAFVWYTILFDARRVVQVGTRTHHPSDRRQLFESLAIATFVIKLPIFQRTHLLGEQAGDPEDQIVRRAQQKCLGLDEGLER